MSTVSKWYKSSLAPAFAGANEDIYLFLLPWLTFSAVCVTLMAEAAGYPVIDACCKSLVAVGVYHINVTPSGLTPTGHGVDGQEVMVTQHGCIHTLLWRLCLLCLYIVNTLLFVDRCCSVMSVGSFRYLHCKYNYAQTFLALMIFVIDWAIQFGMSGCCFFCFFLLSLLLLLCRMHVHLECMHERKLEQSCICV